MELAKSRSTIDRRLFLPRRLSWIEGVFASLRGLHGRLQARMWRGECEARLRALASKSRLDWAERTRTATANRLRPVDSREMALWGPGRDSNPRHTV